MNIQPIKKNHIDWGSIRPNGDPRSISKKALTKMIMEKAKDYPEAGDAFFDQIGLKWKSLYVEICMDIYDLYND